jgi:hypothetical protein
MEVYTQVPDKTTRDALKRLSDLLGGRRPPQRRPHKKPDQSPAALRRQGFALRIFR